MADRRFQVFLSSTFADLVDERQAVTQTLLRLRCIPAGMELFPASNRPPWGVIQSVIDTTDYFVLVLAGRYGSIDAETGLSYTEREYEYAVAQGIPVLAFVHSDIENLPAKNVEHGDAAEKLSAFRTKLQDRHHTLRWSDAGSLNGAVATSLQDAFRDDPRPGWVRGGAAGEAVSEPLPAPSTTVIARPAATADGGRARLETAFDVQEMLATPSGTMRVEAALQSELARVMGLPFLRPGAAVDSVNVEAEHGGRLRRLESEAARLIRLTAAAARWGNDELDRIIADLLADEAKGRRLNGSVWLIDLFRAPAMLMLHAAGVGAVAGNRELMLGKLLGSWLEVQDPYTGEYEPAVSVLSAGLLYPHTWSEQALHSYLGRVLIDPEAWSSQLLLRSLQRWSYLRGVRDVATKKRSSQPYLQIEDSGYREAQVVVSRSVRRAIETVGDAHPIFSNGFTGGSVGVFKEAATNFDTSYSSWGNERDWAALPNQGGIMPTEPHFPGDRTGRQTGFEDPS